MIWTNNGIRCAHNWSQKFSQWMRLPSPIIIEKAQIYTPLQLLFSDLRGRNNNWACPSGLNNSIMRTYWSNSWKDLLTSVVQHRYLEQLAWELHVLKECIHVVMGFGNSRRLTEGHDIVASDLSMKGCTATRLDDWIMLFVHLVSHLERSTYRTIYGGNLFLWTWPGGIVFLNMRVYTAK